MRWVRNAPDYKLFGRIKIRRKPGVEFARKATDYEYLVRGEDLPSGGTLTTLVEPPTAED